MKLIELPENYEQRLTIFEEKFYNEYVLAKKYYDHFLIERLCLIKNICYIIDTPQYTIPYNANNKYIQKNMSVESFYVESIINNKSDDIFWIYQIINNPVGDIYIRGNYMEDIYDIRNKRRNYRIDMILDI